jgi:acetoin utilization protein AcuC
LTCKTGVAVGKELLLYSFPAGHPMNRERVGQLFSRIEEQGLFESSAFVTVSPRMATEEELFRFHARSYVDLVRRRSVKASGYLDGGDTPAFDGMFEAASYTVGSTLDVLEKIVKKEIVHGFNPIGGLHHARRGSAAGFCIFNDVGVALETAKENGLAPILYVDIDAHHGDGVYYSFEDDPDVFIIDLHEDGRFLYPGTGREWERGVGAAQGTKVNVELQPGSGDLVFKEAFDKALSIADRAKPALVVFQCGADSLGGDPLTHLKLTAASHEYAASRLVGISHRFSEGRLLALGGGGYSPSNVAEAWLRVINVLGTHPS